MNQAEQCSANVEVIWRYLRGDMETADFERWVYANSSLQDSQQGGAGGEDAQSTDGGRTGSGSSGDRDLDRALDVFDGQILSERADILAQSNQQAGKTPRAEDTLPGTESDEESESSGGGGESPTGQGQTGSTQAPEPPRRPLPAPGPVPRDVPDAKDDDVVARQLREAASAETDPDLRDALWEEYRRYKEGS